MATPRYSNHQTFGGATPPVKMQRIGPGRTRRSLAKCPLMTQSGHWHRKFAVMHNGRAVLETPATYLSVKLVAAYPALWKTPSLILPSEAIIFNAKGLSVAVVQDGIARLRNVNVVRDFGTRIEVNSGVKEGDQVILTPPVDLADGQKVHVRPKPPT